MTDLKRPGVLLKLIFSAAVFLAPGILYSAKPEYCKFQRMENGRGFALTTVLAPDVDVSQQYEDSEILPQYVLTDINGELIDIKKGVDHAGLQGFKITAGEDYRITEILVALARGPQKIDSFSTTSEILEFALWQTLYKPGDRIVIEVKKVVKKAMSEAVPVSGGIFIVPIH